MADTGRRTPRSRAGSGTDSALAARFVRLVVRWRYAVVVFWVLAVALVIVAPPQAAHRSEVTGLVPDDAPSIATRVRSAELFAAPLLTETLIVQRRPGGLDAAAQRRVLDRSGRAVAVLVQARQDAPPDELKGYSLTGFPELAFALPLVNDRRVLPGASEHGTTAITYLFFPPAYSIKTRTRVARTFATQLISDPADALVGVTGATPARSEQVSLISAALPLFDLATILVVVLLIGLHFRSVVAPIVVLTTVGAAIVVSRGLVQAVSGAVATPIPSELEPLTVVLVLGVVADYAIFFLSSLRTALATGLERQEAARRAATRTLPLVVAAVLVVAAGTASVAVARLGFFRVLGPSLALAILTGGLVACTLVPALMAILGRVLFWPERAVPGRRRRRLVSFATPSRVRRSRLLAAASATIVLALALSAGGLPLGFGLIDSLPSDSEPAQAAKAAETGIAPGAVAPTVILLEQPGIGLRRAQLAAFENELAQLDDVAGVIGPREQPGIQAVGAMIARTNDAARIVVILHADPLSADGIASLRRIRQSMARLTTAAGLGGVRLSYGGDTALAEETVSAVRDDLVRVAGAALLVNFLLILLFLRSVVAATYLLAASALALAGALGLLHLVFVVILGHPDVTYFVPFAGAVLLLSLGSDYTIFVAGRVWQHAAGRRVRDVVDTAVGETTGPVTAAGIVLAVSFALLAIVPLVTFRELALILAGGVLLDAFVIRTLIVPVLIHLAGEMNRWPRPPFTEATAAADRIAESPAVAVGGAAEVMKPTCSPPSAARLADAGPSLRPPPGLMAMTLVALLMRYAIRRNRHHDRQAD